MHTHMIGDTNWGNGNLEGELSRSTTEKKEIKYLLPSGEVCKGEVKSRAGERKRVGGVQWDLSRWPFRKPTPNRQLHVRVDMLQDTGRVEEVKPKWQRKPRGHKCPFYLYLHPRKKQKSRFQSSMDYGIWKLKANFYKSQGASQPPADFWIIHIWIHIQETIEYWSL